ncbi:monovalent cation/H(+) antiporter subunit G [Billgrantia kenyensis]|uniref:Monovalent cation/H(+) antiporter subunit G n=1 Tax=Billgrantia kenyensis TaxID=321266 RepID=A0A7V9VYA5_9GAMM|nr:monovalent cation/H(+) antiporter subunit G [Halomonas kenyensis]MBA2777567.1 monovalent cation/H(+) antiporter subunit G [Halomonas kenyensis]MCG6660237.1 Na+/H+ antiporter subunit G [Halomonas kenyensis]
MTETLLNAAGHGLVLVGLLFFLAGSLGLLRFPDIYARLHALTKAHNLGLGLLCSGLALQASALSEAAKMMLVWLLVLIASGIGATLVASTANTCGIVPRQVSRRIRHKRPREPKE